MVFVYFDYFFRFEKWNFKFHVHIFCIWIWTFRNWVCTVCFMASNSWVWKLSKPFLKIELYPISATTIVWLVLSCLNLFNYKTYFLVTLVNYQIGLARQNYLCPWRTGLGHQIDKTVIGKLMVITFFSSLFEHIFPIHL